LTGATLEATATLTMILDIKDVVQQFLKLSKKRMAA